jgi:Pyruvate/2-oxoacid:ferredoxin oxidoreductase delta subunit
LRETKPPYQPPEAQRRLFPEVSGNTLNGLGEADRRRPTPIYWHYAPHIDLPHRALQDYYQSQFDDKPELQDFHLKYGGRGARQAPDKPAVPVEDAAESWTAKVKAFALANEADVVGVAAVDPDTVFEGYAAPERWIIVIGVAMDHARLATAPELPAAVETMTQYNRGTRAARALANFIQAQGHDARPHGGPTAGPVLLIPHAIAAGMGELGKHGSLINRTYGSSFRLAGVLTDLPLVADAPASFGVDDFCASCRLCTAACPPDAIASEKQLVRGETKWFVDFDKCIPYFNDTQGCGICISVCPWSRPGVAPRLAEKMIGRLARHARDG